MSRATAGPLGRLFATVQRAMVLYNEPFAGLDPISLSVAASAKGRSAPTN